METVTYTNHYKYALKKKLIDESADTIRALIMRSGFVFNKDNHAQLINIRTTTSALVGTLDISVATKTFHRDAGSFLTNGFVAGNRVVITGTTDNDGTYTIDTVTATDMVVLEVPPGTDQSNGNGTIASDDELATGNGYTQNTKSVGAVTVTEDDTNDRCDSTFPTITWTAAGGNIGPTPCVLIYDVTADVIICELNFGGEITKSPPDSLNIGNGTLRAA
jgi:hypothetical protein